MKKTHHLFIKKTVYLMVILHFLRMILYFFLLQFEINVSHWYHKMGSIKLLQPPKAMAYGSRPLAIFTIRDTKALTTITRCFPRFMSDLIIKPGNVLDRILPDCCRHTRFLYLHNITTQLCPVIKLLPDGINYIIISVYNIYMLAGYISLNPR